MAVAVATKVFNRLYHRGAAYFIRQFEAGGGYTAERDELP
jgi:hypothetical protein